MNKNQIVKLFNKFVYESISYLGGLLKPYGKDGIELETDDEMYIHHVEVKPQVYKTIEFIRSDGDALNLEVKFVGENKWYQIAANKFNVVDWVFLIEDVEETIEVMNY